MEFGPFRLDTVSHRLWRADERVPVTPKAFDLLRYLIEHRDRLVSQREILDALWPRTHVNPEVVKKHILEIRKALGDRTRPPVFIETFPKRGYQFVAAVREAPVGTHPGTDVAGAAATMVGRDSALRQLERCLERASSGERQLVFVTGEAGVGKTTLVDAFHRAAASWPGLRVARGQCVEGFGGKEPYYPVLEALGEWVRDGASGAVAQALARHAPTWWIQFPSLIAPDERAALNHEVLGTLPARMLREICEALEALTAADAFVLILEDLHWADRSTLDLLSALARRRGAGRLLVVGTIRSGEVAPSESPLEGLKQDLVVHGLCQEIALERLRETEVAQYLAAQFPDHRFPPRLAHLLHRHSDGNALFMATLVQDMLKRGVIETADGCWTLGVPIDDVSLVVPHSLRQLLALHLDALSEREQQLLKAASVAGERFSVWEIEPAAGLSGEEVERLCEALSERQRLIRGAGLHPLADGRACAHYEFRHALYRQVVYERLSDVGRSKLHREIGERLRALCSPQRPELAAEVALHLEAGGRTADAIAFLILAADNADRRFAYRESIQFLEHALRLAPALAEPKRAELEVRLLERVGDAHYWLGSMHASAKAYEAEAERAEEAALPATQVRALSHLTRPFGLIDPDRGIAAIERALRLAAGLEDPLLLAQTEMLAAVTRLLYDTWRRTDLEVCAAARDRMRRLGEGVPAYHRMMESNVKVLQGRYAEALAELEQGIPMLDRPSSPMVHLFALSGKTLALLHSGRLGELTRTLRSGREDAEKNGNDPWLFLFREAWLRTLVFDFEGARKLCEDALNASPEYPTGQPETIGRLATGYVELARGHADLAARRFREILDPDVTPKFFLHWYWRMNARLGLCEVWLASRKRKQARAEADGLLEAAASTDDPNLQALARDARARVAIAGNDWESAEVDVQAALALPQRFEIPTTAWRVHATAAELYRRSGRAAEAEAQRANAEAIVQRLADSFAAGDPMRRSLLEAAAVRGVA
jgi:DNA-binding winged helix-turn-helix (wHTH) protein/tetratricopeptide (TPR) repeat protein